MDLMAINLGMRLGGGGGGTIDAYTKEETDELLAEKTDETEFDAVTASLIDRGAKNFAPLNSGSGDSQYYIVPQGTPITPGNYVVTFKASGYSYDSYAHITCKNAQGGGIMSGTIQMQSSVVYRFTAPANSASIEITIDKGAVSDFMMCTADDYDKSAEYVPYGMTNAELTAAIEGKQDTLTFDEVPTEMSANPVRSGGVFRKLRQKQDKVAEVYASGTMTNSTTITDTGVTVDIPADGGFWQIEGCITWKGSPPTEAQLRVNFGVRNSDYLIARATNTNDDNKNFMYLPVSCTIKADPYYTEDADKTIHVKVWGKTVAATGNCEVCLIARRISAGF